MYTLYWHPISSSLAPMAVLEAAGAPYESVLIDIVAGENFSPTYREIHPYGRVPALRLPEGPCVFESAGLVLHLVDRHPETGLAPEPGTPERAAYYQWLLFMADTIYPSYNRLFRARRYHADPTGAAGVAESARAALAEQWGVLEAALDGRDWLVGAKLSAADVYLLMLTTWDDDPAGLARRCPNVLRVARAAAERPAVARALARHAQNEGFPPAEDRAPRGD